MTNNKRNAGFNALLERSCSGAWCNKASCRWIRDWKADGGQNLVRLLSSWPSKFESQVPFWTKEEKLKFATGRISLHSLAKRSTLRSAVTAIGIPMTTLFNRMKTGTKITHLLPSMWIHFIFCSFWYFFYQIEQLLQNMKIVLLQPFRNWGSK